jgi:GNAT superfamily N-acetyltransferase
MSPVYSVQVIEIRPGSAADAPAIAQVRRESWQAAYSEIIAPSIIDRATAAGGSAASPPPYRRTLVAVAGEQPAVVGYASFGPERIVASAQIALSSPPGGRPGPNRPAAGGPRSKAVRAAVGPHTPAAAGPLTPAAAGPLTPAAAGPLTPAGRTGEVGELYALYLIPAWWSAGVGRTLMTSVLDALRGDRYRRVVLWVLADNARARRFYERAGFTLDGATNVLTGLGGVLEVRYTRDV